MSGSSAGLLAGYVRTLQIVIAAMTAGCVFFLVIVLALAAGAGQAADVPVMTYVASAMAAAAVCARLIIPGVLVAQARRKLRQGASATGRARPSAAAIDSAEQNGNVVKLAQIFVTRTITAAALLEGATFLLLIAFLIERSPLCLIFAALLLLALVALFPTPSRTAAWIEGQQRLLDEERSF